MRAQQPQVSVAAATDRPKVSFPLEREIGELTTIERYPPVVVVTLNSASTLEYMSIFRTTVMSFSAGFSAIMAPPPPPPPPTFRLLMPSMEAIGCTVHLSAAGRRH